MESTRLFFSPSHSHKSISTEARALFFHETPETDNLPREDWWQTLPHKIHELASFFQQAIGCEDITVVPRQISLTAAIFYDPPDFLWPAFRTLLQYALSRRCQKQTDNTDMDEDGEDEPTTLMKDWDDLQLYQDLRTLGWLPDFLSRTVGHVLYENIQQYTVQHIQGNYSENALLESLMDWKNSVLLPWVQDMLDISHQPNALSDWTCKLEYAIMESFCNARKAEIFDMIADYPDSTPAVRELATILTKTRMQRTIGLALTQAYRHRLLHPGAQTSQILQVYMNSIQVLRLMDPTDALVESVTGDLTAYLRRRSDTVRCIVSSLTDSESGSDLYEELHRKDIRPLDQCQYDSEDEEEPPTLDWTPAPSLYYLRTTGNMSMVPRKKPGADVLSMLVGIYGSKDLFVDEYRIMLADKFLSRTDVNIDYEVQNLELLKIRFGETSMRNCEIMIKDMEDSKRINANIRSTLRNGPSSSNALTQDTDIDAVILSHIFWPTLQKETMKHHPRIKAQFDQFSFEYAKLKNPRRLIWFDQLGQMQLDLDVTLHDGTTITKDFTCTPLQATLITHFEDESSIRATDLSNQTGIPVDVIKKKMAYWVLNDVIKAEPLSQNDTVYTLNPTINPDSTTSIGSSMQYDEDEIDGTSVVTGSREAEQIQIYESYIVGMLSNMGQLSLDRIHSMLKMYASTSSEVKYNHTPQQLRSFLQQLCTEEKLECSNGLYKILK